MILVEHFAPVAKIRYGEFRFANTSFRLNLLRLEFRVRVKPDKIPVVCWNFGSGRFIDVVIAARPEAISAGAFHRDSAEPVMNFTALPASRFPVAFDAAKAACLYMTFVVFLYARLWLVVYFWNSTEIPMIP